MSVDEIERRLSNRFALLRGGDRTAPERHRTLIAVIDWSWNLLAESERRMLRRLSRFPDGFSAEAAAAVAFPGTPGDAHGRALDDLDALVTQSLVSVVEGPAGLRYRMLETVREFGDMALVDAGEDELVAAAQAQWARRFAQDALAGLATRLQTAAVLSLEVEHDNLLAVLRAAVDRRDADTIVPIFAALLFHWVIRNQFREAMSFAPAVLELAARDELPAGAPDATAVTLIFAAIMGVAASRAPQQSQLPAEFEQLRQRPSGEALRAGIRAGVRLRRLVRTGAVSAPYAAGAEFLLAGAHSPRNVVMRLEQLRESPDAIVALMAQLFSGLLTENSGDLDRAVGHARAAWEDSVRLGLDWIAGQAAQALSNLASQDDRPEESLDWAERARERLSLIGAVEEINQSDWTAAINKLKLGRREGVAEAFQRFVNDDAAGQQEGFDVLDVRAIGWAGLAEIAAADGRADESLALYRRAVSIYGSRPGVSAAGAWSLISSAGAVAASVYLDRVDDAALAMWRQLRIAARVELRRHGGPDLVDRPVLATAALGLAIGLLGFAGMTDAQHAAGVELIALGERMRSRQDQPMLVRERAFGFAECLLGASAVADARACVAALPDLAACTARLDELLRTTRL